jgi:hypothetical protein
LNARLHKLILSSNRLADTPFIWIFFAILLGFKSAAAPLSSPQQAHKDSTFTEFFRQTNGWAAGNVATSIPLSDGRVLWLFGDSYIDQFDARTEMLPCLFNAHNAVLLQNTNDLMHPRTWCNFKSADKSLFRPTKRRGNRRFQRKFFRRTARRN